MNLKGLVVVITGSSRGFGKALAECFIGEGAKVVISSNEKDELNDAAEELMTDQFLTDVTSPDEVKNLGENVVKKFGRVDIWVNNAGIHIAPSAVEKVNLQKLHSLFEVNFFGYFNGCQVALTQMRKQGFGTIINVNSTAGLDAKPELSAYSSAKYAIRGLTETIRKELSDDRIKVYAVYPGGIKTEIYKEKYPNDFNEYMDVGPVARKVIDNLLLENPEVDLVIRRPQKKG